jgi:hypothetical protein
LSNPPGWSQFERETLVKMAQAGHTALEIAGALPDRTRNSVIGYAHRNKIQIGQWMPSFIAKPKAPPKLPAPKFSFDDTRPTRVFKLKGRGMSLMDAGYHNCRWIIGTKGKDGMPLCCGEETDNGIWCVYHAAQVYMPSKPKSLDHGFRVWR